MFWTPPLEGQEVGQPIPSTANSYLSSHWIVRVVKENGLNM